MRAARAILVVFVCQASNHWVERDVVIELAALAQEQLTRAARHQVTLSQLFPCVHTADKDYGQSPQARVYVVKQTRHQPALLCYFYQLG